MAERSVGSKIAIATVAGVVGLVVASAVGAAAVASVVARKVITPPRKRDYDIRVLGYTDNAIGTMAQNAAGGGHFTAATLRPQVTIADPAQVELAASLHAEAAKACFIAASVNFPIGHEPVTRVAEPASLL